MMKQTLPEIIAIDGPAASGKSTLALRVAERIGYLFFDTGIMYRAVTLAALDRGALLNDETAISEMAETISIDVCPPTVADGRTCDVLVDGSDVTWAIRRPDVDANVSLVSSYAGVRRALSALQRRIGLRGRVVMVGRDIGTVVLPEADIKIYLVASAEERARRRFEEQRQRGESADYQAILAAIQERDRFDSTRPVAPLRPAEDAVIVNSDGLNIEQVTERVINLLQLG